MLDNRKKKEICRSLDQPNDTLYVLKISENKIISHDIFSDYHLARQESFLMDVGFDLKQYHAIFFRISLKIIFIWKDIRKGIFFYVKAYTERISICTVSSFCRVILFTKITF